MGLSSWDRSSVLYLNGIFEHTPLLAHVIDVVANNNLARGLPVFFPLLWLWFCGEGSAARTRIALGVPAACAATILSVALQHFLPPIHLRPFIELAPRLFLPDPGIASPLYSHPNSWPSDTATMFSALSVIVIYCRPRLGIAVFAWTLIVIDLPRAIFGYHYPSDIVAGILLGCAAVWLGMRFEAGAPMLRVRSFLRTHEALASSVLALFLAEMSYLFASTRELISVALNLIQSH